MDGLDSKQRQALLQLRELTDGADDEVSISMLSIVDWDVQVNFAEYDRDELLFFLKKKIILWTLYSELRSSFLKVEVLLGLALALARGGRIIMPPDQVRILLLQWHRRLPLPLLPPKWTHSRLTMPSKAYMKVACLLILLVERGYR